MKKKVLKIVISVICFVLAVIIPIASVPVVLAATGAQYAETYYAALSKQYDRLCSVDEPKVIVVGGSSVAFGLDSELFEELYGMPSVSFGLYGSFGVKVMMDLSKANIRKGDIIVLAPEMTAESTTLYFGAESMLKATESRPDILAHIAFDNVGDVLAASWGFARTKVENIQTNEQFDLEGVYRASVVNEYGEIDKDIFPREGNILATGYLDEPVRYSAEDMTDEFVDYVNDYVSYCRMRGAEVYYSFAPVNERAVRSKDVRKDTADYYEYLTQVLDCEVISDPYAYIYDYRYFYDTNFHLNDSGVVLRTVQLVRDLKLVKGDTSAVDVELPEPPPPQFEQSDIDPNLPYTDGDLFEYTELEGGYLAISGVKEEATELTNIVLPVVYDNKYVVSILAGALSDCKVLEEVTVPVGIRQIDNGVFSGCDSLKRIRLLETSQDNVSVSGGLMDGTPPDCRIVLVNAKKSDFGTGYFWSMYVEYLVEEE